MLVCSGDAHSVGRQQIHDLRHDLIGREFGHVDVGLDGDPVTVRAKLEFRSNPFSGVDSPPCVIDGAGVRPTLVVHWYRRI